ncbi:glycosyltransferase [Candidatus Gottesmanbacteria bacterium]|nr:glycosyltransferase [Candidatus Gottesmanbacteria bacterium]
MKIFVLIPAYNEKGNLNDLISKIEKEFKKQKIVFKIFFVLQGNDGSRELLAKLKKTKPYLDYIYYEKPLGIGKAYKVGYQYLDKTATHILTMDADLNHDIIDLSRFIQMMKKNYADLIIGSRFIKGGRFDEKRVWKIIASRLTNKIVTQIMGIKVKDISSGYRFMKKEVAEKVRLNLKYDGYPSYMEFILYANRYGFNIAEIPITYHYRIWGKSKISSFKTLVDYFRFMLSIVFNF